MGFRIPTKSWVESYCFTNLCFWKGFSIPIHQLSWRLFITLAFCKPTNVRQHQRWIPCKSSGTPNGFFTTTPQQGHKRMTPRPTPGFAWVMAPVVEYKAWWPSFYSCLTHTHTKKRVAYSNQKTKKDLQRRFSVSYRILFKILTKIIILSRWSVIRFHQSWLVLWGPEQRPSVKGCSYFFFHHPAWRWFDPLWSSQNTWKTSEDSVSIVLMKCFQIY